MFARQLQFELLKMFARKRTYIGFGAFLTVQLIIVAMFQLEGVQRRLARQFEAMGYVFEEYYMGLTLAVITIVFSFLLLGALYMALVAGDIVAKEVEEGTMRLVLARPISRVRLMTVKWLACIVYTATLVLFLGVSALTISSLQRGGLGKLAVFIEELDGFHFFDSGEGLMRYIRAVLILCFTSQVISSMALMFSCFRMKPAAATILTLSVLFIDMVLRQIPWFSDYEHFFITHHTVAWARSFGEVTPWASIVESLVYLAALNVTFWVIGTVRFCTRDLKT